MATKLGKTVTYLDGFLPIKLHDPLITWSCDITRLPKIISVLPQCLSPPHLACWRLVMRGFCQNCHVTFWLRGLARSRDKLIYLHYQNIYGYKTRQDGDLPGVPFTYKVKWPYNSVFLLRAYGHKTWQDNDLL